MTLMLVNGYIIYCVYAGSLAMRLIGDILIKLVPVSHIHPMKLSLPMKIHHIVVYYEYTASCCV